jgi:hypothetical protein
VAVWLCGCAVAVVCRGACVGARLRMRQVLSNASTVAPRFEDADALDQATILRGAIAELDRLVTITGPMPYSAVAGRELSGQRYAAAMHRCHSYRLMLFQRRRALHAGPVREPCRSPRHKCSPRGAPFAPVRRC